MTMAAKPTRRDFLRLAASASIAAAGGAISQAGEDACPRPSPAATFPRDPRRRKLILVLFGGGTRSSEAIDDPQHRYVPRLSGEMVPRGTLFTNMRVEHLVVHPNCTASIKTGHWEWDDLDWSRPPAHPTFFEAFRRRHDAPDTAAWSFVYASILAQTSLSRAAGYGERFAANVVEPPTIPRTTAEEMDRRMARAAAGSMHAELQAARECARLARSTSRISTAGLRSGGARRWFDRQYRAWKEGTGTTSHDAFLTDAAVACMEEFSPAAISVDFGEIDCAHYGVWSRYVDAIRRTDELTWRLWRAAERLPDYRGNTLMLILPDHGRELDRPGHSGFIHHSNFYTNEGADEGCRRVWMLALGPGIAAGRTIDRPVPITAAAATGLDYLDLPTSPGAAPSVLDAAT
ncbi:MAG: twin-arginine translocation signal domain-containing protein [Pirellulales bacterium]|nr:twin-arginine translocation signal domain-containing protein [Pirellulales bacterium]